MSKSDQPSSTLDQLDPLHVYPSYRTQKTCLTEIPMDSLPIHYPPDPRDTHPRDMDPRDTDPCDDTESRARGVRPSFTVPSPCKSSNFRCQRASNGAEGRQRDAAVLCDGSRGSCSRAAEWIQGPGDPSTDPEKRHQNFALEVQSVAMGIWNEPSTHSPTGVFHSVVDVYRRVEQDEDSGAAGRRRFALEHCRRPDKSTPPWFEFPRISWEPRP